MRKEPREIMQVDVLIVGAGPAGLAAAIHLAKLCKKNNQNLSIAILEKAAEVGRHTLSGAVLEPTALSELIPNWSKKNAPINVPVSGEQFLLLTRNKAIQLPIPKVTQNRNNYIISLGLLCKWLATQAQALDVEIFCGFAGTRILYDENKAVCGVGTGDMGIDKKGQPTDRFQAGVDIHAKQTLFAEGCRGSLTQQLFKKFHLHKQCDHQTYAIGIKELWEVPDKQYKKGQVLHSIGWPLDKYTYGGSFLYHFENNKVAVGFVVGLDYQNPYLDPFEEFQRFKTHPAIAPTFQQGKRLAFGARALVEGGYQAIPKLTFPGGLIIGDAAGFINVPKIKGTHNAIRSGMIAAQCIYNAAKSSLTSGKEFTELTQLIKRSAIGRELKKARNIRPAFRLGLWTGLLYSAVDTYLFHGNAPWTFHFKKADHGTLKHAKRKLKIDYPKPDNQLTFDKLSSVYLSNVKYEENQPCHLKLKNTEVAVDINLAKFDLPESRYCPVKVYELVNINGETKLQINASNCIHCKTCDIKDPKQNITWVPPQGGDGPNYSEM